MAADLIALWEKGVWPIVVVSRKLLAEYQETVEGFYSKLSSYQPAILNTKTSATIDTVNNVANIRDGITIL